MVRQDRRGEMGQRVPAKICRNVAYLQLAGGVSKIAVIGPVAFQVRFDSLSDRSVLPKELGSRDSGIGEKEEQVAPRLGLLGSSSSASLAQRIALSMSPIAKLQFPRSMRKLTFAGSMLTALVNDLVASPSMPCHRSISPRLLQAYASLGAS